MAEEKKEKKEIIEIPKELSKPAKEAAVQAFTDLKFSIRKIAEILGIDKDTVMKYQKAELNEEFRLFSDTIKKIYLEQDFELAELAIKYMKTKINTAKFYELVGLYKIVRELQREERGFSPTINILQQQAIVQQNDSKLTKLISEFEENYKKQLIEKT